MILFVRMQPGHVLDAGLEQKLRKQIRDGASPRHVPAKIIAVADIPRTISGKIVELAVRNVIHGLPVKTRMRWPTRKRWRCSENLSPLRLIAALCRTHLCCNGVHPLSTRVCCPESSPRSCC